VLIDFFFTLKDARIPVSIKEFLLLLEALQRKVISPTLDNFYYLARTTLVKDEAHFDKFDQAFGRYFKGIQTVFEKNAEIPLEWLIQRMKRELSPEQQAQLEKFGYDKLMDRLQELLEEQKERHEGGSKWIGTAALRRSATAAAIRKASASAAAAATAPRSRYGMRALTATMTTNANWARAISRSPCAGCASSRAKA